MTLATITETLALPADGSAATLGQTRVRLRLVAAVDGVATAYTAGLTAVVADAWERVGSDGAYSFTGVRPNSGGSGDVITTPTGTVYEHTVVYPDRTTLTRYLDVPDSAGPHAPATIEVADPVHIDRWSTAHLSDVSDTAATYDGDTLVWDASASEWVPGDKEDPIHGRPRTEPMRALNVALAEAATKSVKVVVVGDSISQDWRAYQTQAGFTPSDTLFPSWVRLAEVDLAERFAGGRLGVGWVPIKATIGTDVYGFDSTAGAAVTDGLGGWGVELENGETAQHVCEFDAVEVFFRAGAGSIQVRVDGSLVDTIDTATEASPWVSSDLGAVTSRTLLLTSVGTTRPYAAYFHSGTLTSGIALHNGGHSGWSAVDHTTTTTGTLAHIEDVQPDVVIVEIGIIDSGFGLAAYQTRIAALVTAIQAVAPDAAIVHVCGYAINGASAGGSWETFRDASRRLAQTNGWGFVDLFEVIGDVGAAYDTYSLDIGDSVHLTEIGHRIIADTILEATVGAASRPDGFLRRNLASGTTDITHPTGGKWSFLSFLATPLLQLRRTADAEFRASISESGIGWGDGVSSTADAAIQRLSAGIMTITGAFKFTEQTDPSAPAANGATLYARDNGSGKTQLCVRFATGAVQVLATEP